MQLTDSHCHIQSIGAKQGEASTMGMWAKAGDTSVADVLARAQKVGVTRMICVGCDLADSQQAVDFVAEREGYWASVGIHPHEAQHYVSDAAARALFAKTILSAKVVAVGECGLDYFYDHSDKISQLEVLKFQIELAHQHNLPVIFHVRDAFDDFWPVFESYHSSDRPVRGVLHSFTDTQANLDRALQHGLSIGVNGIATFTKNPKQLELYRTLPLENLLLETDAPFLTPAPDRGKICEPYHIRTIAEFLAQLRGVPVESIADATTQNARQLFSI